MPHRTADRRIRSEPLLLSPRTLAAELPLSAAGTAVGFAARRAVLRIRVDEDEPLLADLCSIHAPAGVILDSYVLGGTHDPASVPFTFGQRSTVACLAREETLPVPATLAEVVRARRKNDAPL